jgi:hypothetical protein
MKWILIAFILGFLQVPQPPFLPEEEFDYEIEFFIKKKTSEDKPVYEVNPKRTYSDVLPYVKIHFAFASFKPDDKRIRLYKDGGSFNNKRIKGPMKLTLDMGYTVDMKEGITPARYSIVIFNDQNEPRARITVEVKPNGELLINDQASGIL